MTRPPKPDRAWKLLEQTEWTQGCAARNKHGTPVPFSSPVACCFCTVGAIAKVYKARGYVVDDKLTQLENYLASRQLKPQVATWNDQDGQTKEEVISILKELDI